MSTKVRRRGKDLLTARSVADQIVRRTAGMDGGPLRIDFRNVSDDEFDELVELTEKNQLSVKEQRRFEELVEIGVGDIGLFARLRDFAEMARLAASAKAESVRRRMTRQEERGLLAALGEQVRTKHLYVDRVAVLLVLLCSFESGVPFGPHAYFDGVGNEATLVIDANWGLIQGSYDPYGMFAKWKDHLARLETLRWFSVERLGPQWKIRLGVRALRAIGDTPAAARAAKRAKAAKPVGGGFTA